MFIFRTPGGCVSKHPICGTGLASKLIMIRNFLENLRLVASLVFVGGAITGAVWLFFQLVFAAFEWAGTQVAVGTLKFMWITFWIALIIVITALLVTLLED